MAYLAPAEFAKKVVDAGEAKLHMATRDVLIRAFMAGAILALAAVFAVTIAVQTGVPLIGALLFPVGFCMLYSQIIIKLIQWCNELFRTF